MHGLVRFVRPLEDDSFHKVNHLEVTVPLDVMFVCWLLACLAS